MAQHAGTRCPGAGDAPQRPGMYGGPLTPAAGCSPPRPFPNLGLRPRPQGLGAVPLPCGGGRVSVLRAGEGSRLVAAAFRGPGGARWALMPAAGCSPPRPFPNLGLRPRPLVSGRSAPRRCAAPAARVRQGAGRCPTDLDGCGELFPFPRCRRGFAGWWPGVQGRSPWYRREREEDRAPSLRRAGGWEVSDGLVRRPGVPASRWPGVPASRWPGGPVARWPGVPAPRRPGGPVVRWSGGPVARPGVPVVRRPGGPVSRWSGVPAPRRPGGPASRWPGGRATGASGGSGCLDVRASGVPDLDGCGGLFASPSVSATSICGFALGVGPRPWASGSGAEPQFREGAGRGKPRRVPTPALRPAQQP